MTLSPAALTLISSAWFAVQDSVGIEIKRFFDHFVNFVRKKLVFRNAWKVRLSHCHCLNVQAAADSDTALQTPWLEWKSKNGVSSWSWLGSAQVGWFCVLAKVPIFISCFENQNGPFFVCNAYVFHSVPASESALRLTDRILFLPEIAVSLNIWRIWRIHQPGAAIFTDSKVHRSRKKTRSEGCEQTF